MAWHQIRVRTKSCPMRIWLRAWQLGLNFKYCPCLIFFGENLSRRMWFCSGCTGWGRDWKRWEQGMRVWGREGEDLLVVWQGWERDCLLVVALYMKQQRLVGDWEEECWWKNEKKNWKGIGEEECSGSKGADSRVTRFLLAHSETIASSRPRGWGQPPWASGGSKGTFATSRLLHIFTKS